MKARLSVTLKTASAEEAQRTLKAIGEGLLMSGSAGDYHFEIETEEGVVTERCILAEGKVVA